MRLFGNELLQKADPAGARAAGVPVAVCPVPCATCAGQVEEPHVVPAARGARGLRTQCPASPVCQRAALSARAAASPPPIFSSFHYFPPQRSK